MAGLDDGAHETRHLEAGEAVDAATTLGLTTHIRDDAKFNHHRDKATRIAAPARSDEIIAGFVGGLPDALGEATGTVITRTTAGRPAAGWYNPLAVADAQRTTSGDAAAVPAVVPAAVTPTAVTRQILDAAADDADRLPRAASGVAGDDGRRHGRRGGRRPRRGDVPTGPGRPVAGAVLALAHGHPPAAAGWAVPVGPCGLGAGSWLSARLAPTTDDGVVSLAVGDGETFAVPLADLLP